MVWYLLPQAISLAWSVSQALKPFLSRLQKRLSEYFKGIETRDVRDQLNILSENIDRLMVEVHKNLTKASGLGVMGKEGERLEELISRIGNDRHQIRVVYRAPYTQELAKDILAGQIAARVFMLIHAELCASISTALAAEPNTQSDEFRELLHELFCKATGYSSLLLVSRDLSEQSTPINVTKRILSQQLQCPTFGDQPASYFKELTKYVIKSWWPGILEVIPIKDIAQSTELAEVIFADEIRYVLSPTRADGVLNVQAFANKHSIPEDMLLEILANLARTSAVQTIPSRDNKTFYSLEAAENTLMKYTGEPKAALKLFEEDTLLVLTLHTLTRQCNDLIAVEEGA